MKLSMTADVLRRLRDKVEVGLNSGVWFTEYPEVIGDLLDEFIWTRRRSAAWKALAKRLRAKLASGVLVPPYISCEVCGATGADCADGEWQCGSESSCNSCGVDGSFDSFDHETGHTFWVLCRVYEDDE